MQLKIYNNENTYVVNGPVYVNETTKIWCGKISDGEFKGAFVKILNYGELDDKAAKNELKNVLREEVNTLKQVSKCSKRVPSVKDYWDDTRESRYVVIMDTMPGVSLRAWLDKHQRDELQAKDIFIRKCLVMSFFEYIFEAMRKKTIDRLESQGLDRSLILKPVLEDYEAEPYKKFEPETVQDMIKRVTEDPKKLVNLNSQFRMPGNISDIISEWFYEGNYHSSYNMDKFSAIVPGTDKPLVVISTSKAKKRKESQPASKMGYQNLYEAELIANMVADIVESQQEKAKGEYLEKIEDNIGIISAYGAQVRLIRERLGKKKLGIKESQIRSMVASLDSFQGQERPLILYSLTRSTTYKKPEMGRVGFMKELRRLNVAFTRCQKQLVIVGDIDYLTQCMNMEALKDEGTEWPCAHQEETEIIDNDTINQCAECPAICERKFARFMRLLMQHVDAGAGNSFQSEDFFRRNA